MIKIFYLKLKFVIEPSTTIFFDKRVLNKVYLVLSYSYVLPCENI